MRTTWTLMLLGLLSLFQQVTIAGPSFQEFQREEMRGIKTRVLGFDLRAPRKIALSGLPDRDDSDWETSLTRLIHEELRFFEVPLSQSSPTDLRSGDYKNPVPSAGKEESNLPPGSDKIIDDPITSLINKFRTSEGKRPLEPISHLETVKVFVDYADTLLSKINRTGVCDHDVEMWNSLTSLSSKLGELTNAGEVLSCSTAGSSLTDEDILAKWTSSEIHKRILLYRDYSTHVSCYRTGIENGPKSLVCITWRKNL